MDVAKSKHLMFVYKFDAHMNIFLLVVNSDSSKQIKPLAHRSLEDLTLD